MGEPSKFSSEASKGLLSLEREEIGVITSQPFLRSENGSNKRKALGHKNGLRYLIRPRLGSN